MSTYPNQMLLGRPNIQKGDPSSVHRTIVCYLGSADFKLKTIFCNSLMFKSVMKNFTMNLFEMWHDFKNFSTNEINVIKSLINAMFLQKLLRVLLRLFMKMRIHIVFSKRQLWYRRFVLFVKRKSNLEKPL